VAEAVVEDETGSMYLTLWDDDIGVAGVGDTVHLRNGYIKRFKGSMRLTVGRRGTLEIVDDVIRFPRNATRHRSKTQQHAPDPYPSPQAWWSYGTAI
jgi:replication factor A1